MPTFTGTSVLGQQLVYTITQAPTFIYIELASIPQTLVRRQGWASLRLKRSNPSPHVEIAGKSIWGQGCILIPQAYPGTAINNQLWINWLYADIPWTVFY